MSVRISQQAAVATLMTAINDGYDTHTHTHLYSQTVPITRVTVQKKSSDEGKSLIVSFSDNSDSQNTTVAHLLLPLRRITATITNTPMAF